MDIFNQLNLTEICDECQEFVTEIREHRDNESIINNINEIKIYSYPKYSKRGFGKDMQIEDGFYFLFGLYQNFWRHHIRLNSI